MGGEKGEGYGWGKGGGLWVGERGSVKGEEKGGGQGWGKGDRLRVRG